MRGFLKLCAWIVGLAALAFFGLAVYPQLSQETANKISFLLIIGVAAYVLTGYEREAKEFRARVLSDLYEIKRRIGADF